jgi:hypothetical protein
MSITSKRIGPAGNDHSLTNFHCLPQSKADSVYGVADPSEGVRIESRSPRDLVRHSVIDVMIYDFERFALGSHTFDRVNEILSFPRKSESYAFPRRAAAEC